MRRFNGEAHLRTLPTWMRRHRQSHDTAGAIPKGQGRTIGYEPPVRLGVISGVEVPATEAAVLAARREKLRQRRDG